MERINGFIVAPFTPFKTDGSINLNIIDKYCDLVVRNGLNGDYDTGSTR